MRLKKVNVCVVLSTALAHGKGSANGSDYTEITMFLS